MHNSSRLPLPPRECLRATLELQTLDTIGDTVDYLKGYLQGHTTSTVAIEAHCWATIHAVQRLRQERAA